jgi:4-hydroxybenzoate polyprenyltransferase
VNTEICPPPRKILAKTVACIKILRVPHYLKNVLIFVPLFFSKNALNLNLLISAGLGFAAFSILASIIYIINDIQDKEKDRLHKTKRNRPIASESISVKEAVFLAGALTAALTLLLMLIVRQDRSVSVLPAIGILALYAAINLGYTFGLKNLPIIDISILAAGYVIRAVFGAMIIGVDVSVWLYLTVTFAAFYMGFGKRRNEITGQKTETRAVMRFYTHAFLDKNMYVCQVLCVVFYAMWSFDSATVKRLHTTAFVYTIPLVFIMLLKYSLCVEGDADGDPITVILHDKVLCALAIVYIIAAFTIIYQGGIR